MKNTIAYRSLRIWILSALYSIAPTRKWAYKRLPRHKSGYKHYWIDDKAYLTAMPGIQERLGMKYISPTIDDLKMLFYKYNAETILDIGCGWGRTMEQLNMSNVEGCDVSDDLLAEARKRGLNVFKLDLVEPHDVKKTWDVSYAMLVFCFLIDRPDEMRKAMETSDRLTKEKILIWEWKHVCDYMHSVYPSDKFEYHHLPLPA